MNPVHVVMLSNFQFTQVAKAISARSGIPDPFLLHMYMYAIRYICSRLWLSSSPEAKPQRQSSGTPNKLAFTFIVSSAKPYKTS